jgi:hypothetical protein
MSLAPKKRSPQKRKVKPPKATDQFINNVAEWDALFGADTFSVSTTDHVRGLDAATRPLAVVLHLPSPRRPPVHKKLRLSQPHTMSLSPSYIPYNTCSLCSFVQWSFVHHNFSRPRSNTAPAQRRSFSHNQHFANSPLSQDNLTSRSAVLRDERERQRRSVGGTTHNEEEVSRALQPVFQRAHAPSRRTALSLPLSSHVSHIHTTSLLTARTYDVAVTHILHDTHTHAQKNTNTHTTCLSRTRRTN